MNCKQAQFLMALFIANDPDLTGQQHTDFQEHLKSCSECAKEYEESKFAIELAKQYWPITDETAAVIEKSSQNYKPKMTVEEGWKDLCRRCPDLTGGTEKPKSLQLLLRIGAVAACLVMGVLTWMVFTNNPKQQTLSQNFVSPQVATVPDPSVKVELVKPAGNIVIDASQTIAADKELKTLLINGKHQMRMNVGTVLKIEPTVKHSNIGCLVRLDSGQIYTHVQHDGNPFIVDTANGQAVITGTTFEIKATKDSTTLVVSEGTVCFESEKGAVNVAAGQKSKIVNQSVPSIPLACNTYELTAWATGYKANTALAQDKLNDIDLYLELPLRTDPIVLSKTNYDHWVNEKRTWFKTNFPWIFELKDALAREGIEVDYPEILIKGGDAWQFVSLQRFPGRFSVPDFEFLLKTVVSYGFDKEWLLENVPIAKLIQNKSLLSEHPTGLDALDQLLKYLKGTEAMPYYLYPADAGRYLTETRSLIWFAVNNGEFKLTDEQRAEVLDLLQQVVIAATNCFNDLLYPEDEKKKPLCGEVCDTPEMKMAEYIEAIKTINEKIAKYEVY